MTTQILKRLFDSLAFANVGSLSEFHRELERREPLTRAAEPVCKPVARGNVITFRRDASVTAPALHNPLLPKARLKP
jgi:hypothetical protein